MGEAFDRTGAFLGAAEAETKREVFDKLLKDHPDAHEIRIRSLEEKDRAVRGGVTNLSLSDKIETLFTYHKPEGLDPMHYDAIRSKAKELAQVICDHTPVGADQSAAIRKLRECVMTANAAVALKGIS